jgi:hypothetical protein
MSTDCNTVSNVPVTPVPEREPVCIPPEQAAEIDNEVDNDNGDSDLDLQDDKSN